MATLGLGTAALGRPVYLNIRENTFQKQTEFNLGEFKEKGLKLLQSAYDLGIRHFDTAPNYGIAENIIISWLLDKQYSDVSVSSKWGYTYTANFDPNAKVHEEKNHSLQKITEQWRTTQKLLPFLNTLQIHSATLETGVLDNQEVLQELHRLKTMHNLKIGLTVTGSNQPEVLKKALDVEINEKVLFSSFQVTFNIFDQSLSDVLHLMKGKQILIKEALANGRVFPNDSYPNYQKHFDLLHELSGKYKVGIDAVALRFCMDSIPRAIILSGASEAKQLQENLKTKDFKLTDGELEQLRKLKVAPRDYWRERAELNWS